jgi:hypothetical protein
VAVVAIIRLISKAKKAEVVERFANSSGPWKVSEPIILSPLELS